MLLMVLLGSVSALAGNVAEDAVFASKGAAYYHADSGCRFGAVQTFEAEETKMMARSEAEELHRACPACAREWKPLFSGDFPEWTHENEPWQLGFQGTDLPFETLSAWGNIADAVYEEEILPDDWAGVFRNACGGYTLLLVNPTIERVSALRTLTGCEFWVIGADYSQNALENLQNSALSLMGGETGVHTIGLDTIGNRITIGTDLPAEEAEAGIVRVLTEMGFSDRKMYSIENMNRGSIDF